MKKIITLLFLLLCTKTALAQNLCDASCNLTITFPDGGSITAVEPLTITFGDGGYLNDGIVATGYAAGDLLLLMVGESIEFQNGGVLDLGVEGNLEYTNISITDGSIEATAIGGSEIVYIYKMALTGGVEFNFNSDVVIVESGVLDLLGDEVVVNFTNFTVEGTLNVAAGTVTLNASGALTLGNTNISGTLNLNTANPVWVAPNPAWVTPDTCDSSSNGSLTISSGTISNGATSTIVNTTCLGVIGGGVITLTPGTIGVTNFEPILVVGDPVILVLTQELMSKLPDGLDFVAEDGSTCTIKTGECVTAAGVKYVIVDGKLVPTANSNGSDGSGGGGLLNIYLMFVLFLMRFCLRSQNVLRMRKC